MFLAQNLRFLRKQKSMTQMELADKLAVKRTMISAYEDGRSEPKLSTLSDLVSIFGLAMDELLFHDIEHKGRRSSANKEVKILAIPLDHEENETIAMVPQKASAGYLNGYSDPEYMQELPMFHLPQLPKNKTYRAFEISGDSMLPLPSGTVVIGAYVEQVADIKSGKTYVLVTESEGVVYKRVFNYLEEKGKLFLVSDNKLFQPYEIAGEEVLEIWESKAYISTDFPSPKDKSSDMTLEDLADMITDLRSSIIHSSK
ncbi:hypothetical protein GCM10007049_34460 [Echinicola pacifica]|uniref:HTH cro/C1-type domain-containing protein n=1 Tax=Echinicola pacifica TaxID=346377 RepID=A0A918UWL6_9BACT|nr:LexA family transcriptional regulator [Echinicola pacifica]GGZ38431.1 hypothetical protein GCM10007049_34460 [Echinicola pacifica]